MPADARVLRTDTSRAGRVVRWQPVSIPTIVARPNRDATTMATVEFCGPTRDRAQLVVFAYEAGWVRPSWLT
jgi:hypothetical protein